MSNNRKNGKNMALWMAPDDATTPVLAHAVLYVTGLSPSFDSTISNVTAAGDLGAEKVGGIPDGKCGVNGRLDLAPTGGSSQLFAAQQDGQPRNMWLVWDEADPDNHLEFVAIVKSWGANAQQSTPWDWTAALEITGDSTGADERASA